MPKLPYEQLLLERLRSLGCHMTDNKIYCNCGADLKARWNPDVAADLRAFIGINAEKEIVDAVIECVKHGISFHEKVCNVSRRHA